MASVHQFSEAMRKYVVMSIDWINVLFMAAKLESVVEKVLLFRTISSEYKRLLMCFLAGNIKKYVCRILCIRSSNTHCQVDGTSIKFRVPMPVFAALQRYIDPEGRAEAGPRYKVRLFSRL